MTKRIKRTIKSEQFLVTSELRPVTADLVSIGIFLPLLIFFVALLIRCAYLFEVKNLPLFRYPILDSAFYDQWARDIARGDWLSRSRQVLALSPGYAYLLAFQYIVIGRDFVVTAIVQSILGAATASLVFFAAFYFVRDKIAALICGVLYAFYSPAICYDALPITATLINFLNSVALVFIIQKSTAGNGAYYFFAGLMLGLSSLFRPTVLLVPILIAPAIVLRQTNDRLVAARRAGQLMVGLVAPLIMFSARNLIVTGKATMTAGTGSMNFFIGNNKSSTGTYQQYADIESANPLTQLEDYRRAASRALGSEVTLDKSNAYWRLEAFNYIRDNPTQWLILEFKKLIMLLSPHEIGVNVNYYYFLTQSRILWASGFVTFPLLVLLACSGVWLAVTNSFSADKYALIIFSIYCLSYGLVGLIFFVTAEYRFPLPPTLVVLSAPAIVAILSWVKSRSLKKIAMLACWLTIGLLAIQSGAQWLQLNGIRSGQLAYAYTIAGDVSNKQNDVNAAIADFNEAIDLDAKPAFAPIMLSNIYIHQKKYTEAISILERTLPYNGKMWEIYKNLGLCAARTNDMPGAENYFRVAYSLYPSPENKHDYELAQHINSGRNPHTGSSGRY